VSIPFTKAQAVGNDFLVIERSDLESAGISNSYLPGFAKQICHRYFGVGADGLEVVSASDSGDAEIHLWNSDGSSAELSGNGTRCVAAYLTAAKRVAEKFSISTDAGNKQLELLNAAHPNYVFKMAMGLPSYQTADIDTKLDIAGSPSTVTLVNVGNPQCAMFADDFEFDWRKLGAAIEQHPHFPDRTNVSFIRVIDCHTIDVRFWERGAGETMSSGTGSTGAAAAAIISKRAESPITVKTVAGDMTLDWTDQIYLTGGAQIIATGYYNHTVGL
jgi:diaminopimelate epimerase